MIPSGVEIFVGLVPVDLRWGFDRLSGIVEEQIGRSVRSGALFVFFGKRKFALKILFFDGSGMCIFYKRLDRAIFRIPDAVRLNFSLTLGSYGVGSRCRIATVPARWPALASERFWQCECLVF